MAFTQWRLTFAAALMLVATVTAPTALADTTIAAWNVAPVSDEGLADRANAFRAFARDVDPDVIVLIETTGLEGARTVAELIGWTEYEVAVSDWSRSRTNPFFALEVAVLSKVPIESATEYDPSPDGTLPVVDAAGEPTEAVVREIEPDARGIPSVSPLAGTDRVTLRVDLANGLTLFPVHLKSNRNGACIAAEEAIETLEDMGIDPLPELRSAVRDGFERATNERLLNAVKRERVMAAVKVLADEAVAEGRTVAILGDYNVGFEAGLVGTSFDDCKLADFGCARGPFPAEACRGADGYDDTFAVLTVPLVGTTPWTILTDDLPRTFDDAAFADRAIDHIAVPASHTDRFAGARRADSTYGSDHYPIIVEVADE